MLEKTRNIGISAHIDSGKTTTSERILFYSGKIHRINEVKGDGAGATMDFMELEKERGITITSAATTCEWKDHKINLIDTPGHVDFTVEVERSLRVLDGAVMLLCAVGGVQSQSYTVDRQMKRYSVPRIAFINKLDRTGANPLRVIDQMREKLKLNVVPLQISMGVEDAFVGLIDLVEMKAVAFEGANGEEVRRYDIPAEYVKPAADARHAMLEALSMEDESMMEAFLEGQDIATELIHAVIRQGVLANRIVPVLMGSAYHNKGVQLLLDGVVRYLPSPLDREVKSLDPKTHESAPCKAAPEEPLVALAFKLTEEQFGQLTYVRIYRGTLRRGDTILNVNKNKKLRMGRMVRMHANHRNDEVAASAGDIVAMVGVECSSGDTFTAVEAPCLMESMFVPEPVVSMSIKAANKDSLDRLAKALNRFSREDPTFRVRHDQESSETIISGMGELQLDVYAERIRREYNCQVALGRPRVAYRETITKEVRYEHKHKKQTGGSGQYAHIKGMMVPVSAEEVEEEGAENGLVFVNELKGMNIPREFIPAVEAGFRDAMAKGPLADYPVLRIKMLLQDGSAHDVDSSEMAFKTCARAAFVDAFREAKPVIMEPIMKVEVETPMEFQGTVSGDLCGRRGMLTGTDMNGDFVVVKAEVPLAEMFGYANDLRSKTQGKCGFTMEFCDYRQVPNSVQEEIVAEAERIRKARHA